VLPLLFSLLELLIRLSRQPFLLLPLPCSLRRLGVSAARAGGQPCLCVRLLAVACFLE
jgi:hypothetical protein